MCSLSATVSKVRSPDPGASWILRGGRDAGSGITSWAGAAQAPCGSPADGGLGGEFHPAQMRETGSELGVSGDEFGTRSLRDRDVDHVVDGPVLVPAGQFERLRVVLGHAPHREAAE